MPTKTSQKEEEVIENVFTRIKHYEHDFTTKPITIVPGYVFDQLATIKRVNLYYGGRYETGNGDELGTKFFYNISKPKVKNAAKNLNIGVKDVNIITNEGRDYRRAWVLRRDLRKWMRERKFGEFINKLVEYCPRFGSVVVKKVSGDQIIEIVDLRNLKNDPTADTLTKSWSIEDHYYTATELKILGKDYGWDTDKINEAVQNFKTYHKENYVDPTTSVKEKQGDATYIHVKEFRDDVPESWVIDGGSEDDIISAQFILVSPEDTNEGKKKGEIKNSTGLILYRAKKDSVYKDLPYDKEDGRWLGVGVMEDNFEPQMMKNESVNQLLLAMRLANLLVFATDDKGFAKNIITDVINGDVLSLKGRLQRVPTEIRNSGAIQILSQEIEKLSNNLSNSYEVTTGESLPSGTPFALGQMLNASASKLFDFIREKLGLFLEDIINDWVLPELVKSLNEEHILELVTKEEMEWLVKEYLNDELWNVIKKLLRSGHWPTVGEMAVAENILRQRLMSKDSLYLKLPQSFYKDILKTCHAIVTNDEIDKRERFTTLSTILQMLGANPSLISNPVFKQLLDYSGFSEIDVSTPPPENPAGQTIDFTPPATAPAQGGQPMAPQMPVKM